jgi:branched-chain amino acid transport system permease protein
MRRPRSLLGANPPATVGVLVIGAATLVLPQVLSAPNLITYVTIGLATIVVAGLSLLMGFAGQVSLGQGAFYGFGAYTAAILAIHGWPPLVALVAAVVLTAAVAAAVGALLLRLEGHALAFGTLALQLIFLSVLSQTPSFSGGAIGLTNIPPLTLGPIAISGYRSYAYFVWIVAAVVLLVSRNITRSRPGRGLRAMATSPSAAAAAGVGVVSYKLRDFALSAAYAGLAGAIYAFFLAYISPDAFSVMLSIEFVIMVVVGGLGTVSGAFVGAAVVTVIAQVLTSLGTGPSLPAQLPNVLSEGVYALILITLLRLMPDGIVGLASRLTKRLVGTRLERRATLRPSAGTVTGPVLAPATVQADGAHDAPAGGDTMPSRGGRTGGAA